MPTTKQVVEWIKLDANGWNVDGPRGILPVLNVVQNLMLEEQTSQHVLYDPTTGIFPTFNTQDGVFEYEIANVWRITQVLIKYEEAADYNLRTWYGDYAYDDPRQELVTWQKKRYMLVGDCRTIEATISDNARIIFSNDPGDTTGYFHYRGYARPTQITSVSIPLTVPEKYHLPYVVPAVIEFIKAWQVGGWSDAIKTVMKEFVLPVRKEMNEAAQGDSPDIIEARYF